MYIQIGCSFLGSMRLGFRIYAESLGPGVGNNGICCMGIVFLYSLLRTSEERKDTGLGI